MGYEYRHPDDREVVAERIEAIIEDTLILAREGTTVDGLETVALTDLIGRCWGIVESPDATPEIVDDLTVRGDPDRLQHVFENLFRNSVEHGSTGSRTGSGDSVEHGSTGSRTGSGDGLEHGGDGVTVRVGRAGEDGIYVEDDGPGIPASERDRVFESGVSSAAGGTGFGLAIVNRIAEAHGWGSRSSRATTAAAPDSSSTAWRWSHRASPRRPSPGWGATD
ncbi:MAG: sensor histidine kinase [Haloferacaceae archaeon]